ncbi:hypothetical protein, partial [Salipiger bermudensis]|uniref:hypothetical protein n=1 Tax=Salipiger bermudensis TaxID=344736 RepID=UPI003518139D
MPQNYCGELPAGVPISALQLHLRIRNQGDAGAGASTTTVLFSPSAQLDPVAGPVDLATPARAAGAAQEPGGDLPRRCVPGGG